MAANRQDGKYGSALNDEPSMDRVMDEKNSGEILSRRGDGRLGAGGRFFLGGVWGNLVYLWAAPMSGGFMTDIE